jgi:hypothetical protein
VGSFNPLTVVITGSLERFEQPEMEDDDDYKRTVIQ